MFKSHTLNKSLNIRMHIIAAYMVIVFQVRLASAIRLPEEFNVDGENGKNCEDCLEGNSPCKSIWFVYSNAINYTASKIINITIHGGYHLNSSLHLNISSIHLKELNIQSYNDSAIITGSSNATFIVGSEDSPNLVSYKVSFRGLHFHNFKEQNPAIIIAWNTFIHIENCSFRKNLCSALNTLDTQVEVYNSVFANNSGSSIAKGNRTLENYTFPNGSDSAGGALGIIFSKKSNMKVILMGNIFEYNRAVNIATEFVSDELQSYLAFSRVGGGALIAFISETSYNNIKIENNIFRSNSASLGGGLMLSFNQKSGYNTIIVKSASIILNMAGVTGGGFVITTWKLASNNNIYFLDCLVSENIAFVGGGGKILLQSRDLYFGGYAPATQIISFKNVTFTHNKASSTSGLHIIYNIALAMKPSLPIKFTDVSFSSHSAEGSWSDKRRPTAFSGVLLTNRVDLQMEGNCSFFNNTVESPISLSNSELTIKGNVKIFNNHVQTSGGGMTLSDVSHVHMEPGSHLSFEHNFAQIVGGALSVHSIGFPNMVYKFNPSCFIQYGQYNEVPPSQWNVTISFIKNGAGLKGAAIFANTITPCIWSEDPPYFDFSKALRWEGVFYYKGNYLSGTRRAPMDFESLSMDIATDTIQYEMKLFGGQVVEVAPGQEVLFRIAGYDELGNPVYSVPVASTDTCLSDAQENQTIQLNQLYYISEPNKRKNLSLQYSIESQYYKQLEEGNHFYQTVHFVDSYSSFPSDAHFTIKTTRCYPGFVYRNGQCICDMENKFIVRCDDRLVYILKGYWANVTKDGKLIISVCPGRYCDCKFNKTKLGCAFNYQNPDLQCAPNRGGILCGKCINMTGLDLMTSDCLPCEKFSWAIVVLVFVGILFSIISVLIILLNPRFSTLMRGILFFVQMLPYACRDTNPFSHVIFIIASWLDLGGANNLPVDYCFLVNFSNLYAITLGYLYPGLILLILFITYVLSKCHLVTFRRNSPFQSFWILMVIMYKFVVETSLLLLFCVKLNDEYVFFYDGNMRCYKDMHLILTLVAAFVLIVMVLPPPILVPLIVSGNVTAGPSVADALAQGLRKHVRWWWSFDFLRRIAFIAAYVFIQDWQWKQMVLMISSVLILVFHVQMQPYKNRLANCGETFLLLSLTLLTTIPATEPDNMIFNYMMGIILISACLYIIGIVLYLFVIFCMKRCRNRNYAYFEDEEEEEQNSDEELHSESFSRRLMGRAGKKLTLFARGQIDRSRYTPPPLFTRSDYEGTLED